jgi:hypothetical protein
MATGKKKVVKKAVIDIIVDKIIPTKTDRRVSRKVTLYDAFNKLNAKAATKGIYLDFEIDKLTNSIENRITKDSFDTLVIPITTTDLKKITKANGWKFDWKKEASNKNKLVCKLILKDSENQNIIHGLVSTSIEADHVKMHLIESAPFNFGENKAYLGVAGNLVAFACNLSFANGFDGFIIFDSKTNLMSHYTKTLGAKKLFGNRMVIETAAAQKLVNKYFNK